MEKYDSLFAFGQRVKHQRESIGMSQQELAQLVGYKSRSSINKIELGKNDVVQSTIQKLADALQTTPAYLMGWEDLVAREAEEARSGRRTAREEMFRTHGTEHSISSLQLINDKVALLYYKAMDRYSASSLLTMIEAVDDLERDDVENISQVVQAYLRADAPIKKIVDTALQPYFPNDNDIGE